MRKHVGSPVYAAIAPLPIAGYGVGARLSRAPGRNGLEERLQALFEQTLDPRLEYLLVPLVFGLGAPLVAMVGTCIGAGEPERAMRAAWIGAALAGAITESIGLWAAAFPHAWLTLFSPDPAMLAAGTESLQAVGPTYGFFGVGLVLYFASQGAGRLLWPVLGNIARLAVAAIGGRLALHWGGRLFHVFVAQAAALVL